MASRLIADTAGLFTCEVDVCNPVLREALDHHHAEDVLCCAVIMALSALAQDEPWPARVMDSMAAFMVAMRDEIGDEDLC